MKSECLPFSQIPHTTRLFADFLSYSPAVQAFYPRSPHFADWFKEEASKLHYEPERRRSVSDILERQNRSWGASPQTLENVSRLRSGASAAVTGQQVGLFGGPLFSIFKALSAVKLAKEAAAGGVDCVPIFWLATEDHDLQEVNHTAIPGPAGHLEPMVTPTRGLADAPVGTVQFGPDIEPLVEAAATLLPEPQLTETLRHAYRPGETLGSAFARLFTQLFADWGVILLDASDPGLHAIAQPIYQSAIQNAAALDDALLARGRELESAGYHQQVKVTPSSTLLFTFADGARVPIHRRANGNSETEFVVGEKRISKAELLRLISATPHHFSANVLLRPVVQDHLLPTLAYTGGSAEIAYFAQAAVVYEKLMGRITPVVPRFSATLIEPKQQALLDRYQLRLPDLFHGPELLREKMAARVLPAQLQSAFDSARQSLETSMAAIKAALQKLDVTLVGAAHRAASKMDYQLTRLRSRAARAELRHTELTGHHADLLSNTLYPRKTLQEREVAGIYFLARNGLSLLHQLYDAIHTDCLDHQVISL